jgi:hypothetical protein
VCFLPRSSGPQADVTTQAKRRKVVKSLMEGEERVIHARGGGGGGGGGAKAKSVKVTTNKTGGGGGLGGGGGGGGGGGDHREEIRKSSINRNPPRKTSSRDERLAATVSGDRAAPNIVFNDNEMNELHNMATTNKSSAGAAAAGGAAGAAGAVAGVAGARALGLGFGGAAVAVAGGAVAGVVGGGAAAAAAGIRQWFRSPSNKNEGDVKDHDPKLGFRQKGKKPEESVTFKLGKTELDNGYTVHVSSTHSNPNIIFNKNVVHTSLDAQTTNKIQERYFYDHSGLQHEKNQEISSSGSSAMGQNAYGDEQENFLFCGVSRIKHFFIQQRVRKRLSKMIRSKLVLN